VGVKSTLFDGRVVLNLSGYRYDYNGMQIYQGVGSAQSRVVNADAQIYGLDAELRAILPRGFSLDVNANYLDDYFTNFASADASDPNNIVGLPTVLVNGVPTPNLRDNSLPGVPDYNVTAGLQKRIPISWGVFDTALLRVEGAFVGRLDIEEWNRPQTTQNAFVKLNAVAQLMGGQGWTVRLYGRNLTNEATSYHFLWNGGANVWSGQYSPPRTFGVEITKTFGG
jgi:iron complex outermembrane receptor protein